MTLELPTDQPHDDPRRQILRPPDKHGYAGFLIAVTVAAIVAAIVLILFLANDSPDDPQLATTLGASTTAETPPGDSGATTIDGSSTTATTSPTATSATTATTGGTTSTPMTTVPTETGQAVVWPAPGSGTEYATPEAAALGFAQDLIGFKAPVMGEFRQGDGRSGEIEFRPGANGPTMTVLLRQVGAGDSWSVIAVTSENIIIDQPGAGDLLANPAVLQGKARAFEGQVNVQLHANGRADPVAVGFVTGRGDGVLGAFDDELDWPAATRGDGVLVLLVSSADDGSPWDVAAIPVRFSR